MSNFRTVNIDPTGPQKPLIFKRLDNGTTDNMNVDGSVTEVVFSVTPPAGEIWRIAHWDIYVEDNGTFDAANWGNGIVLTNGLMPRISISGTISDILPFPILNSGTLSSVAESVQHLTFGTGNEILTASWPIITNGQYLRLTENDSLQLVVRDDLTTLVNQYSFVRGYIE